ncbi:MAG: plastocyanin/azurin family copper-binding protein [Polyangiaceae bacterium]
MIKGLLFLGSSGVALAAWSGCGPGVSGTCSNPNTGNAAELAQKESAPSEAEEPAEKPAAAPAAPAVASADAGPALAGDAGAASGEPAVAAKPGETPAVAAAPAGPSKFNITGTVTSGGKPAKFAVVYLEDAPKDPTRGMKASVDQRMMMFIPYTAVVAAGGAITFVNSDPFPHNVFSPGSEKFDLGTIPKGGVGRYTFKKPGAYTLLCNVHPGMIGYVYAAPSSYFATANVKGQFTIKQVPEGTYKINAWAPKMQGQAKSVSVKGAEASVDLEVVK